NACGPVIQLPHPMQMKFSFADEVLYVYEGKAKILVKLKISRSLNPGTYTIAGDLQVQACSDKVCLPPSTVAVSFPITIGEKAVDSEHTELFEELDQREITISSADDNEIASMFNEKGYFWAFFSIFLIGLALNLTPCVYPMMSVTVSLFGGNENKDSVSTASTFSKALVYVLGIVFMYS